MHIVFVCVFRLYWWQLGQGIDICRSLISSVLFYIYTDNWYVSKFFKKLLISGLQTNSNHWKRKEWLTYKEQIVISRTFPSLSIKRSKYYPNWKLLVIMGLQTMKLKQTFPALKEVIKLEQNQSPYSGKIWIPSSFLEGFTQPAFTCSKLIIETSKQGVKYVQGCLYC